MEDHQGHGCQSKCLQDPLITCWVLFLKKKKKIKSNSFLCLQLDREHKIAGLIPRLVFKDKSTYVESSTKVYDDVSETDI